MSDILVFGSGLLGSQFTKYDIPTISREDCDITDPFDVDAVLTKYHPHVVLNCAGIVPKASDHADIMKLFNTNAAGPKLLANACDSRGTRLIQISSDCVFSGRKGNYTEIETPDADTLYGLSKYLGEITEYPHLNIRVSFVGYPDPKGHGLLASVADEKVVTGYDKVFWNGLTATELARMLVEEIIPMELSNVIHLYGETLSKYELLRQAKMVLGFPYQLVKESEVTDTPHESDKTLSSMLPSIQTTKSFRQMLEEMKSG